MKPLSAVFVDSDVVVSSLISSKGAAYLLINNKDLSLYISNISVKELKIVCERLKIDKNDLKNLVSKRFKTVVLKTALSELKRSYQDYVLDENDAHIIAGAKTAKAKFLVTYNLKHYKADKIKADLGILITTPAMLLQYLRSQ